MSLFDPDLMKSISACGNVAVLVIDDAAQAVPMARALLEGGVTVLEPTMRTPAAIDAIRAIRAELPEVIVGAGTVLTPKQLDEAYDAGARFAVSPGLNPSVVRRAAELGISMAPGIMTPSDIEAAVELGCRLLKFFPAEAAGGLSLLKSMAAPYKHLELRYIPTGGLKAENTADYLASDFVAAAGGSWIAPRDAIREGAWDTIRANAAKAAQIAKDARS